MMYPNPASTFVKMELSGTVGDVTTIISKTDGKQLYQGKGTLSRIKKTVSKLLPILKTSYYQLQLTGEAVVQNARLIKQ